MANPIYPKDEIVWVGYYDIDHELRFIMTSKTIRDSYFLYELQESKFIKLGKAKSPKDLEAKFNVDEVIQTSKKASGNSSKPKRTRKKVNTEPDGPMPLPEPT